ncbi:hypothetical protein [Salegentibacter sp. F14]
MIIKELQLLSEALWESIKTDLKFFAPIQVFVKKLSEVDYTDSESLQDIKMYSDKIEELKRQGIIYLIFQSGTNRTGIGSTNSRKWHNLNRNAWHYPTESLA